MKILYLVIITIMMIIVDSRSSLKKQQPPKRSSKPKYTHSSLPKYDINNIKTQHVTFAEYDINTDLSTVMTDPPPPCLVDPSDFGYVNGSLSSTLTLVNCAANIPDASVFPTYYNNKYYGSTTFASGITLSNLIQIDEIEGTSTLQFSLGLSWLDFRFAMPNFWIATGNTKGSFDITSLIESEILTDIFLPSLAFPDAISVEYININYNFKSPCLFLIKAFIVVTLVQSGYNFGSYPGDTQLLSLRYYIYPFDNTQAVMAVFSNVSQSTNSEGNPSFSENPLWEYKDATAYVYQSTGASSEKITSMLQIFIKVSRKGSGIVIRLVVPLLLLILLSALTFWVVYEERVNITITIMLSVSALYIVILNNIPLVGYLTDLDKFVFWMFLLLIIVITLHQVNATINRKTDIWPLRKFYVRVIETSGRVVLLPLIFIYFLEKIPITTDSGEKQGLIVFVALIATVILFREQFGLRASWKECLLLIVEKVNHENVSLKDISVIELLILNYWKFKKISVTPFYISQLISERGEVKPDFKEETTIREVVVKESEKREKMRESALTNDDHLRTTNDLRPQWTVSMFGKPDSFKSDNPMHGNTNNSNKVVQPAKISSNPQNSMKNFNDDYDGKDSDDDEL